MSEHSVCLPSITLEATRSDPNPPSSTVSLPRFHPTNIGHLSSRLTTPLFTPCTPAGVIDLIDSTGISIAGKNAVVLGRSDIVGSPVCALLRKRDATVTQCHSRTQNIQQIVCLALSFSLLSTLAETVQ